MINIKILELKFCQFCPKLTIFVFQELRYLLNNHFELVCNQNQVWVSGTKTQVQFQYQSWSRNFLIWNQTLFYHFSKNFKYYQVFLLLLWIWIFKNLKLDTDLQKWTEIFVSKFGFKGPFMMEKYPILSVTRFSLWNVVSASATVLAESINQIGCRFRYRT